MAEAGLAADLADERGRAVRALLGSPLLDAAGDPQAFRAVVRHRAWLADYFEQTCGWLLTVDAGAGFARLAKRAAGQPDSSRPLRRTRGEQVAFDRRRYQLLCLVCAELVRHPVTTIGLLATAVSRDAGLDTSRYGERGAFVDALRALVAWGALRVTGGEVDLFLDTEQANAMLTADTVRLHRLLIGTVAPSALPDGLDAGSATERLRAEPRYGDADDPREMSDEMRNRWARHRLGRRLLDDPVVHLDELSEAERDYLASLSGRRWLRDRVAEAGLELEERAEGLLAVDADRVATDRQFPAPLGNAHQFALLLVERLVPTGLDGRRRLGRLDRDALRAAVDDILARFPAWARAAREGDGPERLARDAVNLLVGFGLARREPDGSVTARPALARYRTGEASTASVPTLFEETL